MTSSAKKLTDKSQSAQPTLPREVQNGERNKRILIVEDEPGIAEAYREILTPRPRSNVIPFPRSSRVAAKAPATPPSEGADERFELTVVNNAEAALAEVKASVMNGRPFTMGFFDVLLGTGLDGIELVKRIHEIDPNVYAVFVTAYSDRGVDSIQSLLGENHDNRWDYLNKPFAQGEIIQKARNGVALWNLRRDKEISDERLATLQRQLLENERHATVATVARGIGHEFRNILTQIIGRSELSKSVTSVDQLQEALAAVLKASYKASDILDRFRFLHNPKEQRVQRKWTYLHQPIEEALSLMSHQLKTSNVRVCWIRRKSVLLHLDNTAIMQVFVNLIINSTQAMNNSGQIDISIVEIGNRVEVRFRDYGPGVDDAIIERLTEPFFTTKGEAGSGLGLAIAKDIIEGEHDGRLEIVNHPIKGLEVVMTLPIPDAPANVDGGGERTGSSG